MCSLIGFRIRKCVSRLAPEKGTLCFDCFQNKEMCFSICPSIRTLVLRLDLEELLLRLAPESDKMWFLIGSKIRKCVFGYYISTDNIAMCLSRSFYVILGDNSVVQIGPGYWRRQYGL